MPLVQQSTTNKNYQALGMDEVARDIENIIEQVNTNTEDIANMSGGSEYTETIVNISSSEILSMGDTPIELLPAAGAGKYYEYYGLVEFDYGTTYYLLNDRIGIGCSQDYSATFFSEQIITSTENVAKKFSMGAPSESASTATALKSYPVRMNRPVEMFTYDATNPTNGDGTLRVKIYHKTITFGA